MKPEEAIPLLQRGLVGEIYDEKGYLTSLGYEALDAIDSDNCPTLVQKQYGEWVCKGAVGNGTWCSVCDTNIKLFPNKYSFCPNCGSDNRKR